jgi:prophage regulatory protein
MYEHKQTFLRDTQLAARYAVDRTTVWRWVRRGTFPPPAKLSEGCVRWRADAVQEWESRISGDLPPEASKEKPGQGCVEG